MINVIVENVTRIVAPFAQLTRQKLIGFDERLSAAQNILGILGKQTNHGQVKLLGLHGMCGVGKTALAEAIYDSALHRYVLHELAVQKPEGQFCDRSTVAGWIQFARALHQKRVACRAIV